MRTLGRRLVLAAMVLALVATAALLLVRMSRQGGADRPGPTRQSPGAAVGRLSLGQAMAPISTTGFARATEPRPFSFPADHGPHPDFQTEWWYFTGHLEGRPEASTGGGRTARRFGYQLTFFRSALRPPTTVAETASMEEPSAWRSDQIFMAHFALTDVDDGRFLAFERLSRGALGLAGAQIDPFHVWLEDWSLQSEAATDLFPLALWASEGEIRLNLTIEPGGPLVLQGDAGLSRKGSTPGNASFYYSFTRLPTHGRLELGGQAFDVAGSSWLDREWSTSALEPGIVGWDWFALQLSDGRDLMVYRLRRADGSAGPMSAGSLAEVDGSYRQLDASEVELIETRRWQSPRTGVTYPSAWRLKVSTAAIDLELTPLVSGQEHASTVVYWEGAVDLAGSSGGEPVTGRGYVELTGYGAEPDDR